MTAERDLPLLWQLRFSHYNEKARWALDYKGIPHQRRSLAPGLHLIRAKRLWGGSTTPVLILDGRPIGDSTEIIAELERRWPEPALYPADLAQRRRALELEEHFDTELGPSLRGALFDAILPDREAVVSATAQGLGAATRAAANAFYPLTKRILRRKLVDAEGGRADCRRKTVEAFERLEVGLGEEEYLAGGQFSVADLTAAALFCPLVAPPEYAYDMPDPWPEDWQRFRRSLAERPGWRWVREIYQRHRGVSAEVQAA